MATFNDLPDEIIERCFEYLECLDVVICSQVRIRT